MTKSKAEARSVGRELLKKREERIKQELLKRGLTHAYETAVVAKQEVRSSHIDWSYVGGSIEQRGAMRTLSGSAVVYNSRSLDLGGFTEQVMAGAFKRSIQAGADVMCLLEHNPQQMLGRTSSGTLTLNDNANTLDFSCPLPDTQLGNDVQTMCLRRDLSQCSFGFIINDDGDDWDYDDNGRLLRTILDADIFDVSVVGNPAYPATVCNVRSVAELQETQLRKLIVALLRAGKPVPLEVELRLAELQVRGR